MGNAVLQYQHLSPEQKLARIAEVTAQMTLGEAPVHSELLVMRLALELAAEYQASQAASTLEPAQVVISKSSPEPEPEPDPPGPMTAARDQMAVRLAAMIEECERLRRHKRDSQDLLVAKNREIEGLRSKVRELEGRIYSLEEALRNPVHPANDKYFHELRGLMQTAPSNRG